ncbi:amidase [Arthrobacter globiformis]|uniref:Amidase n=1 Tax=Arthrobacter globiformis TaxID=1665 RepID=A0A328HJ71_ARTGO|nr:amidase [Arthrobacter globiformis]RAM38542.1 amidase [Arthrobacter globiformis]
MIDALEWATATELLAAYRSGEASPVEATRAALDSIDRHDAGINAFCLVEPEAALQEASESEARWRRNEPRGLADGVPTSIKDLLLTRGWPTLRGSMLTSPGGDWDEDAPAIARLRENGAVLLGKVTSPEFGWKGVTDSPRCGVTRNPWDPTRTSGGSSGGSAAAVSQGMGPWSVGTDGGGSIRIPAGFTGTVGFKPTYGTVPLYPASPFGTLAHAGPITRSVEDAALMMDILSQPDARDWSAGPAPTRSFLESLGDGLRGRSIAFSPDLGYGINHPEVEAAVRSAVGLLRELGADVEEIDLGWSDPVDAYHVLWFSGAAKVVEGYGPRAIERIDPHLAAALERHAGFSASDFLDATAVRMKLGREMGLLHEQYDLLVTPTLPIPAFEAGRDVPAGSDSQDWTSWTPYTYPFNLTQQPAISVPCGFTSDALPVGLQIIGPRHGDAAVLSVAAAYQGATDWCRRRPATTAELSTPTRN